MTDSHIGVSPQERTRRIVAALRGRNTVQILACMPTNTALLRTLVGDGAEIPLPSIVHSVTTCATCDASMWIGPRQRAVTDGLRMCGVCFIVARHMGLNVAEEDVRVLNPDADSIPRRFAPPPAD